MPRANRKLTRAARRHRKSGQTYAQARAAVLEVAGAATAARDAERIARRIALGATEQDAAEALEVIKYIAGEHGTSYDDAEVWYDRPGNQPICNVCGWVGDMACPECSGCGCDTSCTGWRHREFAAESGFDDDLDADHFQQDCPDCGGSFDYRTGYGCACR